MNSRYKITMIVGSVIAVVWLCAEIGLMIEDRLSLQDYPFYWPFWVMFCLVIATSLLLLDLNIGDK